MARAGELVGAAQHLVEAGGVLDQEHAHRTVVDAETFLPAEVGTERGQ